MRVVLDDVYAVEVELRYNEPDRVLVVLEELVLIVMVKLFDSTVLSELV